MSSASDLPIDRTTPRVLLFGHPRSGKSSLLGALLRAGETQGKTLGAEVIDPSRRLHMIRDHVYGGADFENTRTELVSYTVRLRPWRVGARPVSEPGIVVLMDCDGSAAKSLLKHPDPITEREVRGTVAAAVVQADLIALVVNAGADDDELDAAFDDFLMFLERVHGRKAFEREVGGFPIFVVLTQCDQLARPTDTRAQWESRISSNRRRVLNRFAEFLKDQSPKPGVQSPFLPFGSVDLKGYAVAVHRPELADDPDPPDEPYGVAELFREAFAAARTHRGRAVASDRRLMGTVWAVAVAVASLLAGAVAVTVFQPPPADPGLADRVRVYELQEPPAAVRLAEKNISRNKRALTSFHSDPGFFALPEELRAFVTGRLEEIEDYRSYRARLAAAPAPADARTLEELARVETALETEFALPAEYTWADTEAARLRRKWLGDVPLIRAAEAAWQEWYRGLVNQATALTLTSSFDGEWRRRVNMLREVAAHQPFDPTAVIPGSEAVPAPRGEPVTYRASLEFDRVYQARRDFEFTRDRLLHLRDLADALGLTPTPGDPTQHALDLPPPGPAIDSAPLAAARLEALQRHYPRPSELYPRPERATDNPRAAAGPFTYPEWELTNFPEPGRSVLANRVRESFANGVRHVHDLVLRRLGSPPATGDTPEGWLKVAAALDQPPFTDWGRLLRLLARLENPAAPDPVVELAGFLRKKEFAIDPAGFDLAIPLALRVPQVVPAGPLTITVTPLDGGKPVVKSFKPAGDGTQQDLTVVHRFNAERDGGLTYRPGDRLRVEVPVRSGDERFNLVWDDGATRTFQFDRLRREPELVRPGAIPIPATGVSLTPTSGTLMPRAPVLLPTVGR